jgi:CubicO group peptidase (beta-lactamase class C family)
MLSEQTLPQTKLPRATPESQGIPSARVRDFLREAATQGPGQELHSLLILRQGQVIAEGHWAPYQPDEVHLLFSLTKSFTSTAAGFAIAEGLLSLDDRVLDFFPDKAPADPSENLKAMRVRHLLSMATGHETEPLENLRYEAGDWVQIFLAHPVPFEPGTKFLYNSLATHMVSAIVEKLTKTSLLEYLKPRLLQPLGIGAIAWDVDPQGIIVGGWGMSLQPESIAKFGLLYAQDGMWEGKRILPEGWVAEATKAHIDNANHASETRSEWEQGYGFQFWRSTHNAYRADGAFGQFCVIVPAKDLIVVTTARVDFMHEVLNLIWRNIEPHCTEPLPENEPEHEALLAELAALALAGPTGDRCSVQEDAVTGKHYKNAEAEPFESAKWTFEQDRIVLDLEWEGQTHRIEAGRQAWIKGHVGFANERKQPTAAKGSWIAPRTFAIALQYLREPASVWLEAEFYDNRLLLRFRMFGRFHPFQRKTFKATST